MEEFVLELSFDEFIPLCYGWTQYVESNLEKGMEFDLEKSVKSFHKYVKRNYGDMLKNLKYQAYEQYPECEDLEYNVIKALYKSWLYQMKKLIEEE